MTVNDTRQTPSADGRQDESLRARAADVVDNAREKAVEAYDSARERAAAAGRKAGDTIEDAPMLALAGGLAVGALLAALLPRSRAEQRLLAPVGEKLSDGGRAAVGAAKAAGLDKLGELNLTRDAGQGLVQNILNGLGEAARSSGEAAVGAVRKRG